MVVTQMRNCASIAAESYRPKLKCLKKNGFKPSGMSQEKLGAARVVQPRSSVVD